MDDDNANTPEENETNSGKYVDINFPGLTVSVKGIDMGWDSDHINDSVYTANGDSAFFNLYPGDWMDNKIFKIKEIDYDLIGLFVCTETNIGVDSERYIEVPFCLLSSWKNFKTDWQQIDLKKGNYYFGPGDGIGEPQISYNLEELKAAVGESCDEEWYNEFQKAESLEDISSYLFTSNYTYKIVVRNRKTAVKLERYIVFYTPTSC